MLKPEEVPCHIIYPYYQCGMNFIANLNAAPTVEKQIAVLDFAFHHWGSPRIDENYGHPYGNGDLKSQIIFTDNLMYEEKVWPEIKKICHRGPATHNRRYPGQPDRKIAVYILTWDVYSEWRAKWEKEQEDKKKEEIKVKEEKKAEIKEAVQQDHNQFLGFERPNLSDELIRRYKGRRSGSLFNENSFPF